MDHATTYKVMVWDESSGGWFSFYRYSYSDAVNSLDLWDGSSFLISALQHNKWVILAVGVFDPEVLVIEDANPLNVLKGTAKGT